MARRFKAGTLPPPKPPKEMGPACGGTVPTPGAAARPREIPARHTAAFEGKVATIDKRGRKSVKGKGMIGSPRRRP